ncbi:MAG: CapA family protein [Sandaracinaceae bacterium]|nr:CapA family protein [Sandaracinaceae bacterium]
MRALVLLFSVASLAYAQPREPRDGDAGPTLALGGDVLFEAPLAYQMRRRIDEIGERAAWAEVLGDLAIARREADLALVNLETPISPRWRDPDRQSELPIFASPESLLGALTDAGVDAVTLANNHAYDQGLRGLRQTMEALDRHHLAHAGAGQDDASAARARIVELDGTRVAIVAFTEGTNYRPRHEEGSSPRIAMLRPGAIAPAVRDARGRAELVLAAFHWTNEELGRPRDLMREAAVEAAEAGADLVIGHGTHVPGRTATIETRDGRRVSVLYSLGNLLAVMEEPAGQLDSPEAGVRDAVLAMVGTRWRAGRLEVASIARRHHWIERPMPEAPWLEQGRLRVSRALSIEAELARIEQSACGPVCNRRARAYRRRVALAEAAMRPVGAAEPPTPNEPVEREPVEREPIETVPRVPRTVLAATLPARASIADDDPRLQPWLRPREFTIAFRGGASVESRVDAAAVTSLVSLLRADPSLRVEIVGHASTIALGAQRARRLKGLIAIRGPSRSRFVTRGGEPGPDRVLVRLSR